MGRWLIYHLTLQPLKADLHSEHCSPDSPVTQCTFLLSASWSLQNPAPVCFEDSIWETACTRENRGGRGVLLGRLSTVEPIHLKNHLPGSWSSGDYSGTCYHRVSLTYTQNHSLQWNTAFLSGLLMKNTRYTLAVLRHSEKTACGRVMFTEALCRV